ncbi:biopolymer transporter ExbD, partial [Oleiphilus sp. HI0117]
MNFKRQSGEEVSVDLTPLIDVVFLLLIFFMVSTTFTKESHLEIDLPQSSAEPAKPAVKEIEVII